MATTAKPAAQPGNDIMVTTAFELIGLALLTLVAGSSDQIGKIVVVAMIGLVFGWLLLNSATVGSWMPWLKKK